MNDIKLKTPSFNREKCKKGIVHIGLGNFHRAHQAFYINEYLNNCDDLNWGIIGINLRSNESENFQYLKDRNGKYILKTISTSGEIIYNQIHSILDLYDWSKDDEKAESIFSNGDLKIVTITVSESGYYISENNELDLDLPIVRNNIEGKEKTIIYSYLHKSLKIRKEQCNKPITLLCCDNIRENGVMLKKNLYTYIKACNDLDLLDWIKINVTFPSCVVDRITPRVPKNLAKEIEDKFNINEKCSVMGESFIQWVVEDNFINLRPSLEKVGVQFVENVFPYEEAKIRILNGAHTALSYFGALKGLQTYDQVINNSELQEYFFKFEKLEVIPALGNEIPFNLEEYMMVIFERFKNVNISDKLERIAMDGVDKFPIFILPTIRECFKKNIIPKYTINCIASWYIFMQRINNKELYFNYHEPQWDWIKKFLTNDKKENFINSPKLWAEVPTKFPIFKTLLLENINKLANYK